MSPFFAADVIDQSVAGWAVGFVMLCITGVLGFLVRNAFDTTTKAVEGLGKKLDDMGVVIAKADGDRRVLEAQMHSLERRLDGVERTVRELAEGIAR